MMKKDIHARNGGLDDFDFEDHHTTYPRGHHLVDTVGDGDGDLELTHRTSSHASATDTDDDYNGENFYDEHDDNDDDDDDDHHHKAQHHTIGSPRTPWYGTAIVLLSEVMGTGILSLPYAAKTLGWASTLVAVPLFAAFASYAGWLLAHVQQYQDQDPAAAQQNNNHKLHSFADAATELLGVPFGKLTKICMLLNFGATAIYYLIATANGIGDIVVGTRLDCAYQRSLIAALLLVLPCQCRDFYSISKYLSGPSTCAILIMVFVIVGNLLFVGRGGAEDDGFFNIDNNQTFLLENSTTTTTLNVISNTTVTDNTSNDYSGATTFAFGDTTTLWPQEGTSALAYLQALSAFVFAYQGHAIFLELMSEMKDARQFPYACTLAYFIMCGMYGMTVIVAYGLRGVNTEEFLPDVLPAGVTRMIVGILVCLHITVSYVISCQPLHMWLHATLFPKTFQEESTQGTIHWFLLTCGYLLLGFVVGNLIPFFADVQALIGSLFGAPTVFGWPVAFFLVVHRRQANSWHHALQIMGWPHVVICALFLLVFTPLFCILGTSAAISSIVRDAKDAARPFECDTADHDVR